MDRELSEEDVAVPTDLPPGVTEEDLNDGPDPDDGLQHTRTPVLDVEETT